jgi:lipopolysaccharide/colanic/teichoic acid biosynthesis glycosyltransferase
MTIMDETVFKRMLALERRRCERTESRFALMLIDIEAVADVLTTSVMEQMGLAVAAAMRETDITGWYHCSSIVGVILTALNGTDRSTLEAVIIERTRAVLSLNLEPSQLQQVRISCHLFPEDDIPSATFFSNSETKQFKTTNPHFLKRVIDLFGSLAALVLLSPFFFVISFLIKCTSPGPVFFRQRRIGQFGKQFTFLKFRSMQMNSDPAIHKEYVRNLIGNKVDRSAGSFKMKDDPRITAIGGFLRKTSLDELPQFINVLRGEMSLVGPRPPIPYEFESYSLWHRRRILEAKPGITGMWQVYGRSRTTFDDMVRMDLRYIRDQSLWLDLKILLKTPFAVLSGDGAY